MKVYVLLLNVDIQDTPGGIGEFIEVSTNKESLVEKMNKGNEEIERNYDEEFEEYHGMMMSGKPYYHILEKEI